MWHSGYKSRNKTRTVSGAASETSLGSAKTEMTSSRHQAHISDHGLSSQALNVAHFRTVCSGARECSSAFLPTAAEPRIAPENPCGCRSHTEPQDEELHASARPADWGQASRGSCAPGDCQGQSVRLGGEGGRKCLRVQFAGNLRPAE